MKRIQYLAAAMTGGAYLFLAGVSHADPGANKAYVEAMAYILAFEEMGGMQGVSPNKVEYLSGAVAGLRQVMADYPHSDVAVRIVSQDPKSAMSIPGLERALKELRSERRCREEAPTIRQCFEERWLRARLAKFSDYESDDVRRALITALAATGRMERAKDYYQRFAETSDPQYCTQNILLLGLAYKDLSVIDVVNRQVEEEGVSPIPDVVQAKMRSFNDIIYFGGEVPDLDGNPRDLPIKKIVDHGILLIEAGRLRDAQKVFFQAALQLYDSSGRMDPDVADEFVSAFYYGGRHLFVPLED